MDEEVYSQSAQLLSLIERTGRIYADTFLKEKGVSRGQAPYLMELYEDEGVSQDYLAQKTDTDKSTAARALQKLEAAGFVRREQNPQDKRGNLVYLTDEGRKIYPYVKQLMGRWLRLVMVDLSEDEQHALAKALEAMAKQARAYRQNV